MYVFLPVLQKVNVVQKQPCEWLIIKYDHEYRLSCDLFIHSLNSSLAFRQTFVNVPIFELINHVFVVIRNEIGNAC